MHTPTYLFIPSTFSRPDSGHHHFSSGSPPEPPPWSLLLWVVLHHAAGRTLVEPRSELVAPCFKLCNGYPVLFGMKPGLCNMNVVQLLSCIWLFATPWTAAHQASLSFTISWSLLRLMSIESVMLSNHLIFCCPHLQWIFRVDFF